jgi:hypothetical protein
LPVTWEISAASTCSPPAPREELNAYHPRDKGQAQQALEHAVRLARAK